MVMAPCLATIQASTPKCPGAHTNINTGAGSANYIPCGRPMHWDVTAEQWRCESHGIRSVGVSLEQAA
jgi:hypothetical protein